MLSIILRGFNFLNSGVSFETWIIYKHKIFILFSMMQ